MDQDAPTPRPAATVILIRRGSKHRDAGLQILMGKRTSNASFMPGVWVFPGGAVDPADFDQARRQVAGGGAGGEAEEIDELAHRICGARELMEEVEIEISDPGSMKPWARWITPLEVSKRFDTRFYLALAPPHSKPRPDGSEIVEAAWLGPQEALDQHAEGRLDLVFPTIRQLETLISFESADDLLAAAPEEPVAPILPRVVGEGEDRRVLLDPDPSLLDAQGRPDYKRH